jgi:hypothetical protein
MQANDLTTMLARTIQADRERAIRERHRHPRPRGAEARLRWARARLRAKRWWVPTESTGATVPVQRPMPDLTRQGLTLTAMEG